METTRVEAFQVIGLAIRTTNEGNKAAKEIEALWGRFMAEGILEKIPNKVDSTIYSLYTAYEGNYEQPYTAMLCCKVSSIVDVPEGMEARSFEAGNFVKVSAKGDLTKGLIVEQWSKIWEMNLDRTYTVDFECFGEKAQNPQDAEIDFYVSVN